MFLKLSKYKKIHYFSVVNLLYLGDTELNYLCIYKYSLEQGPRMCSCLETKAAIQIKDDRQQESDKPAFAAFSAHLNL